MMIYDSIWFTCRFIQIFFAASVHVSDFSFKLYMELWIRNPNWLVPCSRCSMYGIFPTFTMYLLPYVFTICIFPIFSINIPYIEHLGDASIRHGNDSRCPCWSWRCVKAPSWHRTPGFWRRVLAWIPWIPDINMKGHPNKNRWFGRGTSYDNHGNLLV